MSDIKATEFRSQVQRVFGCGVTDTPNWLTINAGWGIDIEIRNCEASINGALSWLRILRDGEGAKVQCEAAIVGLLTPFLYTGNVPGRFEGVTRYCVEARSVHRSRTFSPYQKWSYRTPVEAYTALQRLAAEGNYSEDLFRVAPASAEFMRNEHIEAARSGFAVTAEV